jgi:phospholipase/carboxylesterase
LDWLVALFSLLQPSKRRFPLLKPSNQDDLFRIAVADWVVGLRQPDSHGPHPVYLLLHGWTGDENSMWIFAARLPRKGLLIAPRGIYPTPTGGYGWHTYQRGTSPHVADFYPAISKLQSLLTRLNFPSGDFSRLNLVGFSQGAALALTFLLAFPEQVQSAAGLSGFLPDGTGDLARMQPIRNKKVFLAHGTKDELVPVLRARQAKDILDLAGVSVSYCEDEVGHKVSAACLREMESFFSELVFGSS